MLKEAVRLVWLDACLTQRNGRVFRDIGRRSSAATFECGKFFRQGRRAFLACGDLGDGDRPVGRGVDADVARAPRVGDPAVCMTIEVARAPPQPWPCAVSIMGEEEPPLRPIGVAYHETHAFGRRIAPRKIEARDWCRDCRERGACARSGVRTRCGNGHDLRRPRNRRGATRRRPNRPRRSNWRSAARRARRYRRKRHHVGAGCAHRQNACRR